MDDYISETLLTIGEQHKYKDFRSFFFESFEQKGSDFLVLVLVAKKTGDQNFCLDKKERAKEIYQFLLNKGIYYSGDAKYIE